VKSPLSKKILNWLKSADDYTESAEKSLSDLSKQLLGIGAALATLFTLLLAPLRILYDQAKNYNLPTVAIPLPQNKDQQINLLLAELGIALSASRAFFWTYHEEKNSVILRYKNQWGFSGDDKYIVSPPDSPQVSGAQLSRFRAHQKLLCFTLKLSDLPKSSLLARQFAIRRTATEISCPVSFLVGKSLIVGAIAVEFEQDEIDDTEALRALTQYAEKISGL
jgi:hypothetical protein